MKLNDGVLGLIVLAGGVALAVAAARLPPTPGQAYGSAFFPVILGVVLAGAGATLMVQTALNRESHPLAVRPDWLGDPWAVANVLIGAACVAFYVLASEVLGFLLSAVAILTLVQLRFGRPWLRSLFWAAVIALAFQLMFVWLLRVPLPPGRLLADIL